MILKYGTYAHGSGEIELQSIDRDAMHNDRGQVYAIRNRWTMQGRLLGDTQAAITTAINNLDLAYRDNGKDLVFYLDNGSTPTAHALRSADAVGGVRITRKPSFPSGRGAEYATYRTYTIVAEADIPIGGDGIMAFSESIQFSGNGAGIRRFMPLINGPWQEQFVTTASTFRAVQQGVIKGFRSRPDIPPPMFPAAEHGEMREVTPKSAEFYGGSLVNFETAYKYVFESTIPLIGLPNQV